MERSLSCEARLPSIRAAASWAASSPRIQQKRSGPPHFFATRRRSGRTRTQTRGARNHPHEAGTEQADYLVICGHVEGAPLPAETAGLLGKRTPPPQQAQSLGLLSGALTDPAPTRLRELAGLFCKLG